MAVHVRYKSSWVLFLAVFCTNSTMKANYSNCHRQHCDYIISLSLCGGQFFWTSDKIKGTINFKSLLSLFSFLFSEKRLVFRKRGDSELLATSRHEALGTSSMIGQLFYFRCIGCSYFIGSLLIRLMCFFVSLAGREVRSMRKRLRHSVIVVCQRFSLKERYTTCIHTGRPFGFTVHVDGDTHVQADRLLQWLQE